MQIDNNDQDYESAEETANKCKELCRENVNQNVGPLLFFPMKPVSNQYKVAYWKRKLDQVLNSNSELIPSALDLSVDELARCASSKMTQECCQKSYDLDMLTEAIKEKLKLANKEKVKLLTIMLVSWSIQQTANLFKEMLKQTNSILRKPKEKTSKPISDELKQAVEHFYESDQYFKMCPGKKEFVSIKIDGVKQHKQKILL